jgi:predicted hotdog family 3-hydroxylacyl-ACP dehydratase
MSLTRGQLQALLPHAAPVLMLESVQSIEQDRIECLAQLDPHWALVDAGLAPGLVLIETAAQAAAVLEALSRQTETPSSGPRHGYLVGARDITLCERVSVFQKLRVRVRRDANVPPLALFEFSIEELSGASLARGFLSAYIDAPHH